MNEIDLNRDSMICRGSLLAVRVRHRQDRVGSKYTVTWRVERIQRITEDFSRFDQFTGVKDDNGERVWYTVLDVVARDINKRQAMKVLNEQ
jgi:hypothetical protein